MKLFWILGLLFTLNAEASKHRFEESDFKLFTKQHERVIFYFVSDGMPLSLKGLVHIRKIAKQSGYALKVLNDPIAPVRGLKGQVLFPLLSDESFYKNLGVFHHFPSTVFFQSGRQCKTLVPGYKDFSAFQTLAKQAFLNCSETNNDFSSGSVEVDNNRAHARLVHEVVLPRPIKYYYRPIDNEWITYHDARRTALFNRFTGQEIIFQGRYDSVPTPDARYMTLPGPLRFFRMEEIFRNPESANELAPVFTDTSMRDSYQSLGLLQNGAYRAITAWSLTVAFRDYFEDTTHNIPPAFTPGPEKQALCQGQNVATPILSKRGQYIGGYHHGDRGTETTQILKIGENGMLCQTRLNIGMRTSKVDFSYDDRFVTFMAQDSERRNLGPFVQKLENGDIWKISNLGEREAFTFPSFLPNGNVIILRIRQNQENGQREYIVQEYEVPYDS